MIRSFFVPDSVSVAIIRLHRREDRVLFHSRNVSDLTQVYFGLVVMNSAFLAVYNFVLFLLRLFHGNHLVGSLDSVDHPVVVARAVFVDPEIFPGPVLGDRSPFY